MSPLVRTSCLALATALSLAGVGQALPQTAQPAPATRAGVATAPTGHRQPTAADVPPGDSVKGANPAAPVDGLSAAQKADDERARRIMRGVCSDC
jgi:hypothetical protein